MITQQRVALRYGTQDQQKVGTVSKVLPDGRFRVSFDSYRDSRGKRISGGRFWYPARLAANFQVIR